MVASSAVQQLGSFCSDDDERRMKKDTSAPFVHVILLLACLLSSLFTSTPALLRALVWFKLLQKLLTECMVGIVDERSMYGRYLNNLIY